jgi:hypothetical protein
LNILRHLLVEDGGAEPWLADDTSRVRLDFRGQDPQESCFAGPIAPYETDPLSRLDVKAHAVEERWSAKAHMDVPQADERHDQRTFPMVGSLLGTVAPG